jgi:hypothetical protein
MKDTNTFTPRNKQGTERYEFELSDEDMKAFDNSKGPVVVMDQYTGEFWTVEKADCGLNCHCDAIVHHEEGV